MTFEIRHGARTELVQASDELEALEALIDGEELVDGDEGSIVPHDGRPVGADGDDAP